MIVGNRKPLDEILEMKARALQSWLDGEATVFIPTFYAYGMV